MTREPDGRAVAVGSPPVAWHDDDVASFLRVRPQLFGIAYRMLGSVAEAEDVVQDAWIRWQNADRSGVRNPAAFLTTTATRLAINASTSAHARRETYIGPWLPEPVDTSADPTLGAETAEALELAVVLLLQKLTATERAAYILREAFDYSYRELGDALGVSEVNARQLARRARQRLESERSAPVEPARQRELLTTFVAAAREGRLHELEQLFAEDVIVRNDGGGRVHAARVDVVGAARAANLFDNVFRKHWSAATFGVVEANGAAAVLVRDADGAPIGLVSADTSSRGLERVYVVVNPDKLTQFERRPGDAGG